MKSEIMNWIEFLESDQAIYNWILSHAYFDDKHWSINKNE